MPEDLDRSYRDIQAEYDAHLLDLAPVCDVCEGWGYVEILVEGWIGNDIRYEDCLACDGTGRVVPPVLARNPEALEAARAWREKRP